MIYSIDSNLDQFRDGISTVWQSQIPFATALALQWTGREVQRRLQNEIKAKLHNPKRFTVNSIGVLPRKVDKKNPFVRVILKDLFTGRSVEHYMQPHLMGGDRADTGAEYWLRGKGVIAKDQYLIKAKWKGKTRMNGGEVTRMISQFKAFNEAGFSANAKRLKKGKKKKKKKKSTFYLRWLPNNADVHGLLMRRMGKNAKPMFAIMDKPDYEMKIDFYGISEATTKAEITRNFQKAFELAKRTAR